MKKAFDSFDRDKTGSITTETVAEILRLMGQPFNKQTLDEMIEEVDEDKSGCLEFEEFIILAAKFIVEDDEEARKWLIRFSMPPRLIGIPLSVQKELKEAFRLYDKEGNGFIPTSCLKEILKELDDQLSNADLDGMIQEIDSDGSGTVDFDGESRFYLYSRATSYGRKVKRLWHSRWSISWRKAALKIVSLIKSVTWLASIKIAANEL